MAHRPVQITRSGVAGIIALAVVLVLTLGTLGAVVLRAEAPGALGPADWAAVRFTLLQATLSAVISVTLAIPVARALARRRFPGRAFLVTLLGAPFILPVMVAVLGLLAVFGRSGIVSKTLVLFGAEPIHIYGLHGVLIAHVFFNLPLATRLILQGWLSIPAERFRLAASLDFAAGDVARVLERPMLRAVLPGALLVIFLICLTSFAVVLALGGGPKATTVELAIYQAFRFDFDLGKAALLSVIQFALGAAAAALTFRIAVPQAMGAGLDRVQHRWDSTGRAPRLFDAATITVATLFLIVPLAMIVVDGVAGLARIGAPVGLAALRSLGVALGSAAITLALALPIAAFAVRRGSRVFESLGYLTLAASPLVIGTGLFILIFPIADPFALALPVTALVNAAMSLPFALRAIAPVLAGIETDFGRLADGLGLKGMARLRLLWVPRLRRPLGFSAGLAAALSMGDLGVIAMFASPEGATLPLQLFRLMAAYRMDEAAGAALLLLILSLTLFWLFDRGGRIDADT